MTADQGPMPDVASAPAASVAAKKRPKDRGVALIMVLGAIAVMTVMLAEFQDDSSSEISSATADRDSVQAEYMARSAVNLARLLIASEPTVRKAIAPLFTLMKSTPPQIPVWEFSDRILGAFNDAEGAKDFASATGLDMSRSKNVGIDGGHFEVTIVDEDRMIDANLGAANQIAQIRLGTQYMGLMAPPQYNPIFEQKDELGTAYDRLKICQSLIDFADADESQFSCDSTQTQQSSSAVEDNSYYQLLKHPFRAKNAPYDSLEELHMVRGITDDFWATFIDPDPSKPGKRNVTVWAQGMVNINTANAQTLLSVVLSGAKPGSEILVDVAQQGLFLTGVTMARGISMGAPLFSNVNDFVATIQGKGQLGPLLTGMGLKAVQLKSVSEFTKSITVESKFFSVYAVGVIKGFRRETRTSIHAVFDFRNAEAAMQGGGATGKPSNAATALGGGGWAAAGQATGAIAAAGQPDPGGAVVYYRIE